MLPRLFLLFALVPVIELYLLVQVGGEIGVLPTIALVLFTGVAGAWLARTQGLEVLARIQLDLSRGVMPTDSLLDGACILIAGVLLLTPGFITDIFGLLLLLPMSRVVLRRYFSRHMVTQFASRGAHATYDTTYGSSYDTTSDTSGNSTRYGAGFDPSTGADSGVRQQSAQQSAKRSGVYQRTSPFGNVHVVMHTRTFQTGQVNYADQTSHAHTNQGGQAEQLGGFQSGRASANATPSQEQPRKAVIIDTHVIDDSK